MSNNINSPSLTENNLREMTPDERVKWFCKRYREWPLAQAKNTMDRDKKCQKCSEPIGRNDFLAFLLIVFTTIESLGKFLSGDLKIGSREAFIKFIEKYMHPDWQTEIFNDKHNINAKGQEKWYLRKPQFTYAERFYKNFRCGIVHAMFIYVDAINSEGQTDLFDFDPNRETYILGIHPIMLLNELVTGVEKYLKDLEFSCEGSDIRENFHKVFNHYFKV